MSRKLCAAVAAGAIILSCSGRVNEEDKKPAQVQVQAESPQSLKAEDSPKKAQVVAVVAVPKWVPEVNVSQHPAYDGSPCIADDGRVVFESRRSGIPKIFLADEKGDLRQITCNNIPEQNPVMAGDHIVFSSYPKDNAEIYAFSLKDGSMKNISNSPACDFQASLSPDGRNVAFVSTRKRYFQIMVWDGKSSKSLDFDFSVASNPSIADNKAVVFDVLKENGKEVYLIGAEGRAVNISNHPEHDYNAKISKYGNRIVYESTRYGTNSICIYDLALGKLRKIDNGFNPRISARGNVIVYEARTKDNEEVYATRLNDKLEIVAHANVSYNRARDYSPNISPDGKQAAYVSDREENSEVYKVNLENILKN